MQNLVLCFYNDGKSPFINSVFGLILTAMGIPLYGYFGANALKKFQRRPEMQMAITKSGFQ